MADSNLITITNVLTSGWTAAFRGMRNPRNSWDKSDSVFEEEMRNMIVGENDLHLASKLAKLGGPHAKFRRMIHVSMDIYAPLYWWKEFDTYKIGTTENSTSTMNSITKNEFRISDFALDPTLGPELIQHWENTVKLLNSLRNQHNASGDTDERNELWRQIIQMLPESYKQLRTVDFNYEVLSQIATYRSHHKLKEWQIFCKEISYKLPLANELIFCNGEGE